MRIWQPTRQGAIEFTNRSWGIESVLGGGINSGLICGFFFFFSSRSSFSDFSYSAISSSVMTYSSRLANIWCSRCGIAHARFVSRAAFLALALGRAGIVAHAANRIGQRSRFHQQVAHFFQQIVKLEWLEHVGQRSFSRTGCASAAADSGTTNSTRARTLPSSTAGASANSLSVR